MLTEKQPTVKTIFVSPTYPPENKIWRGGQGGSTQHPSSLLRSKAADSSLGKQVLHDQFSR